MRKRVTELGCERSKCPSTILFVKSYKYKLYNDHCHPFMFCWIRKISFLMTRKDSHTILVLVPNKCVKNTFLSIIIVGNPRPVLHVLKAGIWSTRRAVLIFFRYCLNLISKREFLIWIIRIHDIKKSSWYQLVNFFVSK